MMNVKLLLPFLCLALLSSCGGRDPQAGQQNQEKPAPEPVDEDAALLQLSAYLIAEPEGPDEKAQNAIVDHAIGQLIPLERSRSGLFYQLLDAGQGERLQWGDYISVHYKGYFLDGKVFDSSYRRDKPLQFYIGNMVPGWNEGLQLVSPGGRIRLFIPPGLAYGEKGFPDGKDGYIVPPNTPIAFDIEVLERLRRAGEE